MNPTNQNEFNPNKDTYQQRIELKESLIRNNKKLSDEEIYFINKIISKGSFKDVFGKFFDTPPKNQLDYSKYGKPKPQKYTVTEAKFLMEILQTLSLEKWDKNNNYLLNLEIYLQNRKIHINIVNNMIITSKNSIFTRFLWSNSNFSFSHFNFANKVIKHDFSCKYFLFTPILDSDILSVKFPYIMFNIKDLDPFWEKSSGLPINYTTIINDNVAYIEGSIFEKLEGNNVIEKIDLSFRLTKDLGLLIVYFVETLSKLIFSKKPSLKELFLEFWVDYNLTDDTIDYKNYSYLVPFKVTLRFTNISNETHLCVAYIDKTFSVVYYPDYKICRKTKTSPLRKLLKNVYNLIIEFLKEKQSIQANNLNEFILFN